MPLLWKGGANTIYPEGTQDPAMIRDAIHRQVSENYLQTMGISLRHGRYFTTQDNEQSVRVAIVNETMAREYFPNVDAIGRRFKIGNLEDDIPWYTIVGVVADVRQMGLDVPVKPEMYLPYRQVNGYTWFVPRDLAVRADGDPASLVCGAAGCSSGGSDRSNVAKMRKSSAAK